MTAHKLPKSPLLFHLALLIGLLALSHAAYAADTPMATNAQQSAEQATPAYSGDDELWSAKVHVTRGREAAERGEIGLATLHLERARYLRPFDITIRQGLDLLRQQVQRQRMTTFHHARLTQGEAQGLWWWRLFHVLPTRMWAGIALFCLWAAFGFWLLGRRMTTSVTKDGLISASVISLLITLACLSCWTGAVRTSVRLEPGVVVQQNPQFFRAPDALAPAEKSSDLYEGGVVLIRGKDAQWMEIELVGQQRVWVAAHTVEPIAITPPSDSTR